ncbi:MAG: GNAT family N-acetyltransferase [Bacteroidetes bacterium]|nr:GNAT family N-acetyltransferase [Bacteroidota bacterium]
MLWSLKAFNRLSVNELYDLLQMRQQVFVVEQTCPYRDLDDTDKLSLHLTGRKNNLVVAYSRIIPPGILYAEPSIGRVATHFEVRGTGIGRELFSRSLEECINLFGMQPIKIMAQCYLRSFYESYGFQVHGDAFPEDNIPHFYMIRA